MKKIYKMLEESEFPVSYQKHIGNFKTPCIIYEIGTESDFIFSDDTQDEIKEIIVRLYQSNRSFLNEIKLETVLKKHGIVYQKYVSKIDDELIQTAYHFEKLSEEINFYE